MEMRAKANRLDYKSWGKILALQKPRRVALAGNIRRRGQAVE